MRRELTVAQVAPRAGVRHRLHVLQVQQVWQGRAARQATLNRLAFCLQGWAKKRAPCLVIFVPFVAYPFCLNLPEKFSKPGDHFLAQPCNFLIKSSILSCLANTTSQKDAERMPSLVGRIFRWLAGDPRVPGSDLFLYIASWIL